MRFWIITDTHWHQDGTKIDRPVDHTERQFKAWKGIVKEDDVVIHCGDVTWSAKTLSDDLKNLPGRKILVRGNHDKESHSWYMRHGFEFACDSFVMKKVLFTHAPASSLPGIALLNVHGHLHGNGHRLEGYKPQSFNKLLALEHTGYAPISFDKFVGNLGVIELA